MRIKVDCSDFFDDGRRLSIVNVDPDELQTVGDVLKKITHLGLIDLNISKETKYKGSSSQERPKYGLFEDGCYLPPGEATTALEGIGVLKLQCFSDPKPTSSENHEKKKQKKRKAEGEVMQGTKKARIKREEDSRYVRKVNEIPTVQIAMEQQEETTIDFHPNNQEAHLGKKCKVKKKTLKTHATETAGSSVTKASLDPQLSYPALSKRVKKGKRSVLEKMNRFTERFGQEIANILMQVVRIGCFLCVRDIALYVKSVLDNKGVQIFFPENLPSDMWTNSFMIKNQNFSVHIDKHLCFKSTRISQSEVNQFFRDLQLYFESEFDFVAQEYLSCDNAERIFNCDDVRFSFNRTGVLVKKDVDNLYGRKNTYDAKTSLTVLVCISASGQALKPLIINKGSKAIKTGKFSDLDRNSYSVTSCKEDWMTCEVFLLWLVDIFNREIEEKKIRKPVVLFLACCATVFNLEILNYAKNNGIILYCFPPHGAHILQPLNVTIFKPMEARYQEELAQQSVVSKKVFPYILMKALKKSNILENAVNGFRATGLVPFNPSAIMIDEEAVTEAVHQAQENIELHEETQVIQEGKDTWIPEDAEQQIKDWYLQMARIGYPLSKIMLQEIVKTVLDEKALLIFHPGNIVAEFLRKHPDVSDEIPETLDTETLISVPGIIHFFKVLENYFESEFGLFVEEFLAKDNADRIFSCDESIFFLKTNARTKVLVDKFSVDAYEHREERKPHMKVLMCATAEGQLLRPLIINSGETVIKYKVFPGLENFPFATACSEKGRLTSYIFHEWLTGIFNIEIEKKNIAKPVVLFVSFSIILRLETLRFARDNGIIVYCLPSHAHIIQPLNVAVFKAMEDSYREVVRRPWKHTRGYREKMFPYFLMKMLEKSDISGIIVRAFKASGLVPFDPSVIKSGNCLDQDGIEVIIEQQNKRFFSENVQNIQDVLMKVEVNEHSPKHCDENVQNIQDNRKKVESKGQKLTYSKMYQMRMSNALEAVHGGMKINEAIDRYQVSRSALLRRLKKGRNEKISIGRRSNISEEIELEIKDFMLKVIRMGCPMSRKEIRQIVKAFLDAKEVICFSHDNIPTKGWFDRFLGRHPNLQENMNKYLHNKVVSSQTEIDFFFCDLQLYLENESNLNIQEFLSEDNAERIFYCSSIVFNFNVNENRSKDMVMVFSRRTYSLRDNLQNPLPTLLCISASGNLFRPLIINSGQKTIEYKRFPDLDTNSYSVVCSEEGHITSDILYTWLCNSFNRELEEMGIKKPVVLFLDGHINLFKLETLNYARDNGIILYCIPQSEFDVLQPLDMSIFKALEDNYREAVRSCEIFSETHSIPMELFLYVLMKTIEESNISCSVVDGFRTSGLVPFNPSVINLEEDISVKRKGNKVQSEDQEPQKGQNSGSITNVSSVAEVYKLGFEKGQKISLERAEVLLPSDELEYFDLLDKTTINKCQTDLKTYNIWKELKLCSSIPLEDNPFLSFSTIQEDQESIQDNEENAALTPSTGQKAQKLAQDIEENVALTPNTGQKAQDLVQDLEEIDVVTHQMKETYKVHERAQILEDRITKAFTAVCAGMPVLEAGKYYKVSSSALIRRVKKGINIPVSIGRKPRISKENEQLIEDLLLLMAKIGFPLINKAILQVVKAFLDEKGLLIFPPENLPSKFWVTKFLGRHPNVSSKMQKINHNRKTLSQSEKNAFFRNFENYLRTGFGYEVQEFLSGLNAERIFSCDEWLFSLGDSVNSIKVGVQKVTYDTSNNEDEAKARMSVLVCASASGQMLRPLIINKGQRTIPYQIFPDLDTRLYSATFSEKGLVTSDIFYMWLVEIFNRELEEKAIQKPIVLLIACPIRNLSLKTFYYAKDKGIILYCLPPLGSNVLHPLDIAVLRKVKSNYKEVTQSSWTLLQTDHVEEVFPYLLIRTIKKSKIYKNAVQGFRASGLVPFNPAVVLSDELVENPSTNEASSEQEVRDVQSERQDIRKVEKENKEQEPLSPAEIYLRGYENGLNFCLERVESLISLDELEHFNQCLNEVTSSSSDAFSLSFKIWKELKLGLSLPLQNNPFLLTPSTSQLSQASTLKSDASVSDSRDVVEPEKTGANSMLSSENGKWYAQETWIHSSETAFEIPQNIETSFLEHAPSPKFLVKKKNK